MKKAWKIISVLLEVLLIAAAVCNHFVPAVNLFLVPYIKYILIALTVFSVYWVIYLAVAIYHKEVGHEVQGKIKYKKDKERKVETIVEADTLEVYSNFERAEFTSKIKDSYQKQVYAFPANMPAVEEKAIPETAEEVIKSAKPTVRIVTDKKPLAPSVVKASKTVTKPEEPKPVVLKPISKVKEGWQPLLTKLLTKPSIKGNFDKITSLYKSGKIFPEQKNLFKPFELTDFSNVKVVILGKAPFNKNNQADGLAYSTKKDAVVNPQTEIIINECKNDVKIKAPKTHSLDKWAKQGVLLLNVSLTAPTVKQNDHAPLWKEFTDAVIAEICKDKSPKVFILWGEFAKEYLPVIQKNKNICIIESASPAPISAQSGFIGSKPFSKANEYLESRGIEKINWQL